MMFTNLDTVSCK